MIKKTNEQTHEHEVALCTVWLSNYTEFSKKWSDRNSYSYKHDVERWCNCYISNDAFIEAASRFYPARLVNGSNLNYEFKFSVVKNYKSKIDKFT